jgi:solute carrier family 25 uncoupling protein 27
MYSGLAPAVLRHIPYTSLRVVTFETLKANYRTKETPFPALLLFGFFAGALAQYVAVPFDLLKVRMQSDRTRYTSISAAFRDIFAKEGLRGMWRGSVPAVQRAGIVNLGELSTYDLSKRWVLSLGIRDGPGAHILAAVCSGFVSSLLSTPADVVKSRMMEQDPSNPRYRGSWDCFKQAYRGEGPRGLYKGFLPTWARLGPWQLVFWLSYEKLRTVAGMRGF